MEDSKDTNGNSTPVEATPSRSNDLSKSLPEEASNHFLQGKRHIVVQDYRFAVQSLSTACELYAGHFGEMALECAEVHFMYGKALFRLSQQNAGVLGGALNEEVTEDEQEKSSEEDAKENESDKNDSDTEENGEENPEEAEEEEKEPSESTDSPQAAVTTDDTSKEAPEKEQEPEKELDQEPGKSEEADKSVALDESKVEEGNPPTEQEEEDLDDLELAWNSLETAKSIYLRQGEDDVEAQLKVAEILQLLAEISMESDNNVAAINDLKECLVIKRRHLKPDDRLLAETFYQMGLAQMLEKLYDDALENFSTTMSILQLRIDNLRSSPVKDTVGNFERADRDKEVCDLEGVLEDIREKVEDTKALVNDAQKAIREEIGKHLLGGEGEEVGFPVAEKAEPTNKPVTNINHLLKRKKPEQDEEKERDLKRLKVTPDTTSNGVKWSSISYEDF